jgi:phosphatidylglycerol:prolipoprotein diacylglycerol transferase
MEIFTLATLQSAGIFFGGFALALVFAYFYMRKQGLPLLSTADIFAPGVALGHGIGRLGCFAAGCCWGKPTHLPWAVTFTSQDTTTGVPLGIPLHPTQLYEAFSEGVICLILLAAMKRAHKDGAIIGLYLVLYGLARFGIEFLRMHDSSNPLGGPFTLEQWIALAGAAAGAYLLLARKPLQVAAA